MSISRSLGLQFSVAHDLPPIIDAAKGVAANDMATVLNVTDAIAALGALASLNKVDTAQIEDAAVAEKHLDPALALKINQSSQLKTASSSDPTVNFDSSAGYSVGSVHLNTSTKDVFRCFDDTVGAAIWADTNMSIADLGALAIKNTIANADIDNATIDLTTKVTGILPLANLPADLSSKVALAENGGLIDDGGRKVNVDDVTTKLDANGKVAIKSLRAAELSDELKTKTINKTVGSFTDGVSTIALADHGMGTNVSIEVIHDGTGYPVMFEGFVRVSGGVITVTVATGAEFAYTAHITKRNAL